LAASEAGFFDQSHLSRHFKRLCGMTPGQYIAQNVLPASSVQVRPSVQRAGNVWASP
jgi:AraC-like DNA-binding protein